MRGLFVTATGTGVGKTFVTRGLAAGLVKSGLRVAAIKPVETGFVDPSRSDATALAVACGQEGVTTDADLYRAPEPLCPYAIALEGGRPTPPVRSLVDVVHRLGRGSDFTLVEGAGGLLSPLDAHVTMTDLAAALGLPVVLVAPNQLGVLSWILTAADTARHRRLELRAVVLVDSEHPEADPSVRTNARILDDRLGAPVFEFPRVGNDNAALAAAAASSGLLSTLLDAR